MEKQNKGLVEKRTLELKESAKKLKRAEGRLRESQQWFRKIVENVQDGLTLIEEGKIIYINNRACKILGYPREELVKMSGVDIAAPEEKDRLLRIIEEVKKTGLPPKKLEYWIIRKDGTRRSISNRYSVIQKPDGSTARLVVTVDDTERRQAEEALKESEKNYSAVVEQALDGVIIVQDETIKFANRASAQLFGCPVEELVGTQFLNAVALENRDMVAEWYKSRMAGEMACAVCEFKIRCKSETEKIIESSANTIQYQGRLALLSIFRDITERRQAAQALRHLEQEIRLIADNVPGLVSYVDAEGRYRFVNKQYEEWFGLPREKIIGKQYRQVLGNSAFKALESRVNAALSGQRVCYEEVIPSARGGPRWVKAEYIPDVDEGGKTRGFFALATDISSLKDTEKELQRLLEEAARSRHKALAFSRAAQAVQRARTPDEVYRTVGNEAISLGYHAAIFLLSDDQAILKVAYLTLRPETDTAAEKLSGLSTINYSLPLEPGGFFDKMMRKGEAVFLKQSTDRLTEALPEKARPLAKKLSELMGLEQSILAPLAVSGKRFGILIVFGAGLDEVDIPAVTAFANQAAIAIENAQLLEEITKHRKELQILSSRLINIQEEERSKISRALHDEMGQALTALKINLAGIEKKLPAEVALAVRERLVEIHMLTDQMLEKTRDLSLDLRPSMLDDLGLKPALRWYVNRFAQRVNIKIGFDAKDLKKKLPAELETVLYRVVQEALNNIARHAKATEVSVHLESSKSQACLTIADNGQGFDVKEVFNQGMTGIALGLIGMRENVQILGGHFSIQSRPGKGTRLFVELPLND